MNCWTTKRGSKIFQVLSGRSNSYLISVGKQNILVDTGKESVYMRLLNNITQLKFENREISYLLLTHTHFDHCQSAKRLKDETDCQIIVSENAVKSILNGYTKLPDGTLFLTKQIARIGQAIGSKKYGYTPFKPDILIKGEDVFQIESLDIKILKTTGHSEDSISILVDDEIAIVGDTLFGVFRKTVFPPYADNIGEMIDSWKKLLCSDCELFLPGHGNEIKRSLLQKSYDKKYMKAQHLGLNESYRP